MDVAGCPQPLVDFLTQLQRSCCCLRPRPFLPVHFSSMSQYIKGSEGRKSSPGAEENEGRLLCSSPFHLFSFSFQGSDKEEEGGVRERHRLLPVWWRPGWVMAMGQQAVTSRGTMLSPSIYLPWPFANPFILSGDSCFSHSLFPVANPCFFGFRGPFSLVGDVELYS